MSKRLLLALGGCFFALALRAGAQASPPNLAVPADPRDAQSVLVVQCSTSHTRPRNLREWEGLVDGLGLRRKNREAVWELVTAAGELRANALFQSEETSYWLFFFPASSDPVPDAILSHLLKDARYTRVDADQLEIGLAPIEPLPGGGTKIKNITVTLGGGRLVASRTVIQWKEN